MHVVMCKTWSFRAVHVLLDPACSWGTSHFYHSANTGVVAQDGPKDRTDQSLTSGCAEMDKMDEEHKEGSSQYSSIYIYIFFTRIWETGHGVSQKCTVKDVGLLACEVSEYDRDIFCKKKQS